MKLRYRKKRKFNYQGKQYRFGDILEVDGLGGLPENWFEVLEEAKPEKIEKPKKSKKKKEVLEYGVNREDTDEDLDG